MIWLSEKDRMVQTGTSVEGIVVRGLVEDVEKVQIGKVQIGKW